MPGASITDGAAAAKARAGRRRRFWYPVPMKWALVSLFLAALPAPVRAQAWPVRPDGVADFVTDDAGLLDEADEAAVNRVCRRLFEEHRVPLVVVTVATYGTFGGPRIEDAARALFDHWTIGTPDRNLGILLLVATGDRKARIELGADWRRDHDADAKYVMDDLLIPRFRRSDFAGGIRRAVDGLDAMARGQPRPESQKPFPVAIAGFLALLAIAVAVGIWSWIRSPSRRYRAKYGKAGSRRSGARARPYHGWRAKQRARDRRNWLQNATLYGHGTGSSGFGGGGSFGGGFSGGGGATGGW